MPLVRRDKIVSTRDSPAPYSRILQPHPGLDMAGGTVVTGLAMRSREPQPQGETLVVGPACLAFEILGPMIAARAAGDGIHTCSAVSPDLVSALRHGSQHAM